MKIEIPTPHERSLYLFDLIDEDSSLNVIKEIKKIGSSDLLINRICSQFPFIYTPDNIVLHINSRGGTVTDGLAIIDTMMSSETNIHTHVTGQACSCAQLIAMCADKRTASRNARFMIHGMTGGSYGQESDMEVYLDEMKRLKDTFIKLFEKYSKMNKKQIKEILNRKTDFYFSAEEALELGIIDNIE